jgi:predicted transposase/invertase (TIGR01784 family)
MDIKLKTDKFLINIKSQVQAQPNFDMRIFFYITKLYRKTSNTGENYNELKKVLSIALLDHKIKENPDYHNIGGHGSFKYLENSRILMYHTIQVPRILEIDHDLNNKLHRLLIFLNKDSSEKLYKKVIEMDDVLQKAHSISDDVIKKKWKSMK